MTLVSLSGFAQPKKTGKWIQTDPRFSSLISPDAQVEILVEGFTWSEGPVWNKPGDFLLFSDVPENTIYRWKEGEGLSTFLSPSGYTGILPYSLEPGSNGLIFNKDGELVACEHGDRRISKMPLQAGGKVTVADNWDGKRFNSPNDIVQASHGRYYFTDPPYGLPDRENATTREIDLFGVYMVDLDGQVKLVVSDLSRPNGLAFSPDEKWLYVAQSDPERPVIMKYPVLENGLLGDGQLFFDAKPLAEKGLAGLPDGLKVDLKGNVFATGPGGLMIVSPEGDLLGRIETGMLTANCNWGGDGSVLYITANHVVGRIQTQTKGF